LFEEAAEVLVFVRSIKEFSIPSHLGCVAEVAAVCADAPRLIIRAKAPVNSIFLFILMFLLILC
jgi:hypothetical protein